MFSAEFQKTRQNCCVMAQKRLNLQEVLFKMGALDKKNSILCNSLILKLRKVFKVIDNL